MTMIQPLLTAMNAPRGPVDTEAIASDIEQHYMSITGIQPLASMLIVSAKDIAEARRKRHSAKQAAASYILTAITGAIGELRRGNRQTLRFLGIAHHAKPGLIAQWYNYRVDRYINGFWLKTNANENGNEQVSIEFTIYDGDIRELVLAELERIGLDPGTSDFALEHIWQIRLL